MAYWKTKHWERFYPCPTCEAKDKQPCVDLRYTSRTYAQENRIQPHKERKRREGWQKYKPRDKTKYFCSYPGCTKTRANGDKVINIAPSGAKFKGLCEEHYGHTS